MQELYTQSQSGAVSRSQEVSKVLRNTYTLLAMTLAFSALTAGISMALVNAGVIGSGLSLLMTIGAIVLVWFVLPRTANSAAGIWVVFGFDIIPSL